MLCKCGIDSRVETGGITEQSGEKYQVQTFVCVNPKCNLYHKIIGTQVIKLEANIETEMCHGYILSVNGEPVGEGKCPACGKEYAKGGGTDGE